MEQIDGKPITDVLGELEGGRYIRELTKALTEITNAVRETRKDGTLTLKLKIKPTGQGSVLVASTFDAKVPEHDRLETTFFLTPSGALMRDDPNQERLPLRAVEDEQNEPVKIG